MRVSPHKHARRSLLVLLASTLVHVTAGVGVTAMAQQAKKGKAKAQDKNPAKPADPNVLPAGVREMIDLIKSAIQSGKIEDLRDAIDWNEMKPDFGVAGLVDPIDLWKAQSKDASGREVLEVLAALLDAPPAIVPYGRDLENNRLYVWPRFAEGKFDKLSEDDQRLFERLVPEANRAPMVSRGTYGGWRLVLGADGTWHTFRKAE